MKKNHKHHSQKIGMAPGSLVYIGEVKTKKPVISLIEYNSDKVEERVLALADIESLKPDLKNKIWLNVHGLHDADIIETIGKHFKLHPLVLEDILNTGQRPKVDSYIDYLYIVARSFHLTKTAGPLQSEQINLILGKGFVITFQERSTGLFEPVRERLRTGRVQIRAAETDYLAYALLDVIVDQYFSVIEDLGDHCETAEEKLLRKPGPSMLQKIQQLKREGVDLRRGIWPMREVINNLIRNDQHFFTPTTVIYLRDVYDHTVHVIESLEAMRDLLAGMLDIYLSTISNQLNKEVRTLTVVTMLFMPATLITGIFGMNFDYMPLLKDHQGFWVAIGGMAVIAIGMAIHFFRRQWLSRRGI
ncbi:magnesium and cobalt transport protein CorA [Methylovorus sp. MM2]|uniref:magnesium/cobalt transporter CorA n=1 Tax=Methylovorus sp. MM2 TaxID=1848038 RepID=UPI0007DF6D69|nr:magnesium/cobalt transporter CorA [Methylovorus sp. MM2]OAM51161.1 magnesium and cobalt transport protein CorA [Methylovorus sp. MM2]